MNAGDFIANWQHWTIPQWGYVIGGAILLIGLTLGSDSPAHSDTKRVRKGHYRTTYHKAVKRSPEEKEIGWRIGLVGAAILAVAYGVHRLFGI